MVLVSERFLRDEWVTPSISNEDGCEEDVGESSIADWSLPIELEVMVFGLLPKATLARLARVSKHWRDLINPMVWGKLLMKEQVSCTG